MKNCIAGAAALAVAFLSVPRSAHADQITPPAVPVKLQVAAGSKAFLVGHATGTQNYVWAPASRGRCSRRRPRCSATTSSSSPPTSSASTRTRPTTARFAPRGSTRGTRAPSGPNWPSTEAPPTRTSSGRVQSPGSCRRRRNPGGTLRRRYADGVHPDSAAEHLGRGRARDRLCPVDGRRQEGVRALHRGLLLLPDPRR